MNAIKEKSFDFAVRIVYLGKFLMEDKKEYIMSKQVIRSGTAVGALYREAQRGESGRDFIHKLSIALKECDETAYWLDLLLETKYIDRAQYDVVYPLCMELVRLLVSIIKPMKVKHGVV